MRHPRMLVIGALLGVLGALACDAPNTTLPVPGAATRSAAPLATLGTEIRTLIATGFPSGEAAAIGARWDKVLRAIADDKESTNGPGNSSSSYIAVNQGTSSSGSQDDGGNHGNSSAGNHDNGDRNTDKDREVSLSDAGVELAKTVAYIQKKTSIATPPSGETKAHFIARLVLDMSLYVYGGPTTPIPAVAPASDVAFKLIQPTVADTVVTPALQAAVAFPSGAVTQPTVVVITPDSTYYPANCSGPLDTHLCQYPRFYRFNVFPDVKLAKLAKVQVCHIDAGSYRRPLANHDRFRIAHEKPANPANYSAGSTIVDNVEVLAYTLLNVTNCGAGGGTSYPPPSFGFVPNRSPLDRITDVASWMVRRATVVARRLLVPRDVYAIDVGGGGLVADFSMFGVVDPLSMPDLAQSREEGSQFSLASTVLPVGGVAQVRAWRVTNIGTGSSGPFTSSVIIATDSLLTAPVATVPVGGAASLVPASNYSYAALPVALPAAVVAGTYFVGTKVVQAAADGNASNDLLSVRVVVSPPAPDVAVLPGFSISPTSVVQGNSVSTSAWAAKNIGGSTAGPFTARLAFATDTLLDTGIISWPVLGGASSLAAGATFPYPANTVAVSQCQAPGTYFIGPRLFTAEGDANPANDRTSVRLNVLSEAAPASQAAGSASWTAAGAGTVTTQVNPHCANLRYNDVPSGLVQQTFTFTTTAVSTGYYSFDWTYGGLHSWFQAFAQLEAFANGPEGQTVVPLQPTTSVYDFFGFSGSSSLYLASGYTWGIRARGQHFDSSQILLGYITIKDAAAVVIP